MIRLVGVSHGYGRGERVLEDISFTAPAGVREAARRRAIRATDLNMCELRRGEWRRGDKL